MPIPLHFQITNDLRERLENGEWKAGDHFPGDKELMQVYGVSSTTIRRALDELVREGWLNRRPGKGTFVKKQYVETLGKLTGFFDQVRAKGYHPSSQLLRVSEVDIADFEEYELDVFNSKKLFLIEKVQMLDKEPTVLVKSFWPIEIGRQLANYNLIQEGTYEIAKGELGITLEEAQQYIYASLATAEEAKHLGVNEGAAVMVMKRLVFSQGEPVEFSINFYQADKYMYRVDLKNEMIQDGNGIIVVEN
ncbi:GntR family transcriptional regulator [Desulfotomaculum defluvii]